MNDLPSDAPAAVLEVVAEDLERADFRCVLHVGTGAGTGIIIAHSDNPEHL